ncbi:glycerol dehydrogenase [Ethanoligenens harbinense]|uniref:Glycerol dehydrogenase n=1 Tax=Ethanoligenens harbinense (strain DSM 18485 / JCM 12961 / CGMCC 1.5033 / YUAN-3) TaxID=663278 RepID=E6U9A4_ETHHY|nr:glycerol dehydrogenase [Ethanoligenens harbinense]ADU27263.1 iron-containing alcohol dehydrogenase [Ethanoligenens harbinense YUAN-3]AVQ96328.1 glycerol dehydrogenase [Ethanoligenens harbinense YUAN-3]AYF38986.1 glycerol dehydrogenase [Ethanoligenens harbinense]AYF41739.1 glycerol dehydrogenase [Ethanoligenens harbinense]QCN92569.1 glycerol dehydrogenase [Ethanoligenens harbinense]
MLKLFRAPHNYVQGKDALLETYDNVKDFGKSFLFVCSRSAHKQARPVIEKSFEGKENKLIFEIFGGISSNGEIERMRQIVRENDIDVVCGVGGGSAIDTAKATAYYEHRPVVIIPTVAATDAPCTGLSVIYNDDGSFDKYIFYPKNPDVVIVDTTILSKAPVKFLVAGMGDALGTYFEARACVASNAPSLENGGVTKSAMALCELCYETLLRDGLKAKQAVERGLLTPAVESIIEANTFLSGVGADNGGLAVSHSVYNGFTALEECEKTQHGSIVAFGTIAQLLLENADLEEIGEVVHFCISVSLPVTLEQIGVTDVERVHIAAEKACAPGESIHNLLGDVTPDALYDALLAADALGKTYLQ